ncbi:cold-shock protein [Roseibium sp. RKSG952]|uniref:cold-shock protein n=1 Tax=Roseibium sp. RKSG952 TaxID=2529384 RepID=UPI0012BB67E5|nr:cold shock domain-containing protein [Roseibium sp. RKSG952]MTI00059.1 cold-shock protein [Roseibium sp. RKSG952]
MHHGNVKWFDIGRGLGLIEPVEGDDVPVDVKTLRESGLETLREGQLVAYDLTWRRGQAVAEDLKVL